MPEAVLSAHAWELRDTLARIKYVISNLDDLATCHELKFVVHAGSAVITIPFASVCELKSALTGILADGWEGATAGTDVKGGLMMPGVPRKRVEQMVDKFFLSAGIGADGGVRLFGLACPWHILRGATEIFAGRPPFELPAARGRRKKCELRALRASAWTNGGRPHGGSLCAGDLRQGDHVVFFTTNECGEVKAAFSATIGWRVSTRVAFVAA